MRGKGLSLFLAVALSGAPEVTRGQPTSDPEVAKGVKQVEEGDYETAIFTLDAATRRLAAQRTSSKDLGQAYLYLGIAYVAKGHETLAKAKFREALAQTKDLAVNLDKFPPKVLELIEEARHDAATQAAPKKGRSKTGLILLGAGGAAAAGIAVASSGGGQSTAPAGARRTEMFSGFLALDQVNPDFPIAVTGSGLLEAELTWPEAGALLHIFLFDATAVRPPFNNLADTIASTSSPHRLSFNITAGNYKVGVGQRIARNGFQPPLSTSGGTYTLRVTHP
jgi:tetratricopeptide (TPR) repeat protein